MKSEMDDLIVARLQRLCCLGLEGQPAADLIEGTARIWLDRLGIYSANRLSIAFDRVEATARRWPTPATIIAELPVYVAPDRLPAPTSQQVAPDPEASARIKAAGQAARDEAVRRWGKRANGG